MNVLTIPSRFNGPAGIGNGGYVCGRMTAVTLAARPAVGDQYRVIAWPKTRGGRKLTAGSALLGPRGQVLALAEAVWLTVPRPGRAPAAEAAMVAGGAL